MANKLEFNLYIYFSGPDGLKFGLCYNFLTFFFLKDPIMGTFEVCLFFKRTLVFPIEMSRVENFKSALPIVTVEFMKKKNEKK